MATDFFWKGIGLQEGSFYEGGGEELSMGGENLDWNDFSDNRGAGGTTVTEKGKCNKLWHFSISLNLVQSNVSVICVKHCLVTN